MFEEVSQLSPHLLLDLCLGCISRLEERERVVGQEGRVCIRDGRELADEERLERGEGVGRQGKQRCGHDEGGGAERDALSFTVVPEPGQRRVVVEERPMSYVLFRNERIRGRRRNLGVEVDPIQKFKPNS